MWSAFWSTIRSAATGTASYQTDHATPDVDVTRCGGQFSNFREASQALGLRLFVTWLISGVAPGGVMRFVYTLVAIMGSMRVVRIATSHSSGAGMRLEALTTDETKQNIVWAAVTFISVLVVTWCANVVGFQENFMHGTEEKKLWDNTKVLKVLLVLLTAPFVAIVVALVSGVYFRAVWRTHTRGCVWGVTGWDQGRSAHPRTPPPPVHLPRMPFSRHH